MRAPINLNLAELSAMALNGPDPATQSAAIRRLAIADAAGHLSTFRTVLARANLAPTLEVAAIRALGFAGAEAEADLLPRLASSDRRVQRAVIAGLTQAGGAVALESLTSLPPPTSPTLARRISFARRVIAHRLRQPSADHQPGFEPLPTPEPGSVTETLPTEAERNRVLRHLRTQSFGLDPDSATLRRLTIHGLPHLVIFDRALATAAFRASLGEQPALIGLVAEESTTSGIVSVIDALILSSPAPDPQLSVWCRTGDPLLAGRLQITGDLATAQLDQHTPEGGLALALSFRADANCTTLSDLGAARVPGRQRAVQPLGAMA